MDGKSHGKRDANFCGRHLSLAITVDRTRRKKISRAALPQTTTCGPCNFSQGRQTYFVISPEHCSDSSRTATRCSTWPVCAKKEPAADCRGFRLFRPVL